MVDGHFVLRDFRFPSHAGCYSSSVAGLERLLSIAQSSSFCFFSKWIPRYPEDYEQKAAAIFVSCALHIFYKRVKIFRDSK